MSSYPSRKPPHSPDHYVGALQDRVHQDSGASRPGVTVRTKRKYVATDLWETPSWVTEALLDRVAICKYAMDPCAGSGAIAKALEHRGIQVTCSDINAGYKYLVTPSTLSTHGDACELVPQYYAEVHSGFCSEIDVVTNPPWSPAQYMLKVVKALVENRVGTVALLLPLSFLAGAKRAEWLHGNMPDRVLVLSRRPQFANGRNGTQNVAWFVWEYPDKRLGWYGTKLDIVP